MWKLGGLAAVCLGLLRLPCAAADGISLGALQQDVQSMLQDWHGGVVRVVSHHGSGGSPVHSRVASGVVWDRHHVVTYDADLTEANRIDVWLSDGARTTTRFVGADPLTGLAVLELERPVVFPRVDRRTRSMRSGEMVLVMGNAYGTEATVSLGFVSGGSRSVSDETGRRRQLLQLTAPAHPGDAGGAVLDVEGQLVGFVIGSPTGAGGLTLAVPYRDGRRGVERLVARAGDHGFLGVTVEETPDESSELVVAEVVAGGPADLAGLRRGDYITGVDGVRATSVEMLLETVVYSPVGSRLRITARRDGDTVEVEPVVASRRQTEKVQATVSRSPRRTSTVEARLDALERELSGVREELARCAGDDPVSHE